MSAETRRFWKREAVAAAFGLTRWVGALVLVASAIIAAATWGRRLESQGNEDAAVAVAWGTLTALIVIGLGVLALTRPSSRRRRAVNRWARAQGHAFSGRAKVPASMRSSPAFDSTGAESGVSALTTVRLPEHTVLVFDRWRTPEGGYVRTSWWTSAAIALDLDIPGVAIGPPSASLRAREQGLRWVATESEAFNRRFSVATDQPRASNAFLDQRLMAWMLSATDDDVSFDAGGPWVMVSRPGPIPVEEIDSLVALATTFAQHLPRVARSLYPADGSG